ncbi:Trafficking protein particle complex subunit [Cryptosporidium hominis]|uniref:Trafficking protein particle complex subunit n=1 Tax=Cryptosporidium hominis TaxID=237895 RepID=A0ABX5BAV1_CRYHO|nr:Trafficking protein particle complex subunit [Cryptosporidium hominis]|eukprot:PPS93234.1 Trafficking protein particle complex subunit [Cryptosporidium hominis]
MYYSLYINNKNGSLIYQRDFSDIPLTANDRIRLASTFHGLCTIARQISPIKTKRLDDYIQTSNGISSISTELFRLECFETLTASKDAQGLNELLHKVYQGYTDYVLKNPFHDLDMPIRSILFDKEIDRIFLN